MQSIVIIGDSNELCPSLKVLTTKHNYVTW